MLGDFLQKNVPIVGWVSEAKYTTSLEKMQVAITHQSLF